VQHSETVEIRGHLLDTGVLSRCVDDVLSLGGDYVIERFDVGRDHTDESFARIRIEAADDTLLDSIVMASFPRTSTPRPTWRPRSAWAATGSTSSCRRWTAACS
jgi:LOR/SDH bifunctional enzyme conserved region